MCVCGGGRVCVRVRVSLSVLVTKPLALAPQLTAMARPNKALKAALIDLREGMRRREKA